MKILIFRDCLKIKILDCIQDSFLTQHVLLPTRGDNILDLVMSNVEGFVKNLTVGEPFGTGDRSLCYKMGYGNDKNYK